MTIGRLAKEPRTRSRPEEGAVRRLGSGCDCLLRVGEVVSDEFI